MENKLTSEEIDLIARNLEQRNLDFIDLKLEVLDHISCEIESRMEEEKVSFEAASVYVFNRWEYELKSSKNWLIGLENSFPKFVVKNLFKRVLFHYSFVVISVFIAVLFFINNFQLINDEGLILWLKGLIVLFGVVYFLLKRKINQSKIKTTFSFQFDYFYLPVIFVFICLLIFKSIVPVVSLLLFVTLNFPFAFYFYFKHFEVVKNLKLI